MASGLLFLSAMALPAAAWRLGASLVATFWVAYVLTRPLGSSFADWLDKPPSTGGGLGYGDGTVALTLIGAIVVLVVVLWSSGTDAQPDAAAG